MDPVISAIVALGSENKAICDNDNLLWVIPEDHKRLKEKTEGHTLIMGRKTYESIGKPLKGRVSVIVTQNKNYSPNIPDGFDADLVKVTHSVDEAIKIAKQEEVKRNSNNPEVFIFGGGQIYDQTIDLIQKLYLTVVYSPEEGTAHFPEYEEKFAKVLSESPIQNSINKLNGKGVSFQWRDLSR